MKCELDGDNASLIAKAVQSLTKFGVDLYVQADAEGLLLRTLNVTRSAAGSFKFNRSFFSKYKITNQDASYCRINTKACLGIFRNMRQVEQCEIQMQPSEAKLWVQLKCRLDTIKNAKIFVVEDENIVTAVLPQNSINAICGSCKVFNEISNNFNATEEEITLEAKQQHLIVKNYIEGARVTDKFMRSQLKLLPNEFEKYQIDTETVITFCMKEFRAFLHFAEAINSQVTLNFNETGRPVFLQINKFQDIECQLIMSTLAPDDISYSVECIESELTDVDLLAASESVFVENKKPKNNEKKQRTKKDQSENVRKLKRTIIGTSATDSDRETNKPLRLEEQTTLSATESMFEYQIFTTQCSPASSNRNVDVPRLPIMPSTTADNNAAENLAISALVAADLVDAINDPNTCNNVSTHYNSESRDIDCNILRKPINDRTLSSNLNVTFYDTEESQAIAKKTNVDNNTNQEVDSIPQSPQRTGGKTILSIFSRCFEATCLPSEPICDSQVYVADSNSE